MQKVKGQGQGHMRPNLDLESWQTHHSRRLRSRGSSSL